jgi:chromosome partitioning protein
MGAGKNSAHHVGALLLASPEQAVAWPTRPVAPGLELLPSNQLLHESLTKLTKQRDVHELRRLRTRLAQLAPRFDFCLLDCPPDAEGMTQQALHAADCYVVVTDPEPFAVEGLAKIMQRAQGVQTSQRETLRFLGFIIPRFNPAIRGKMRTAMFASITSAYGANSLLGWVRYAAAVFEAQGLRQTLYEYAPDSTAAQDYLSITKTLLSKI